MRVLEDRLDVVGGQTLLNRVHLPARPIVSRQSDRGAKPEMVATIRQDGGDRLRGQTVGGVEDLPLGAKRAGAQNQQER